MATVIGLFASIALDEQMNLLSLYAQSLPTWLFALPTYFFNQNEHLSNVALNLQRKIKDVQIGIHVSSSQTFYPDRTLLPMWPLLQRIMTLVLQRDDIEVLDSYVDALTNLSDTITDL